MTLSIIIKMTIGIMMLRIIIKNNTRHNDVQHNYKNKTLNIMTLSMIIKTTLITMMLSIMIKTRHST
jgi:hypothetical protein